MSSAGHSVDLDPNQGAVWAYRLFASRDPSDGEVAECLRSGSTPNALKSYVVTHCGVAAIPDPEMPIRISSERPIDMRQGVVWTFRFLLNRDLTDQHAIELLSAMHTTPQALRKAILASEEFHLQQPVSSAELRNQKEARLTFLDDMTVIERFKPYCTTPAPSGSFHDFLGVRTRCEYLPPGYLAWSGTCGGPPGAANGPMHDTSEWAAALRSVLEAKDQLCVVELGAGWGPWLVAEALAAAKVGIKNVTLVGVEGDAGHVKFMRQHLIDNGLDPQAHRLFHAVIGTEDGFATFPKHAAPSETYGAEANYSGTQGSADMVRVRCISLETLLADIPVVDILHCDIQGPEGDLMSSARKVVDRRVRRVVIGTHSRAVEETLHKVFTDIGWKLEHDSSCQMMQVPTGQIVLVADGTQVWSNPRLVTPAR